MAVRPCVAIVLCCSAIAAGAERRDAAPPPPIVLPMGRHGYVIGEEVPLGFRAQEGNVGAGLVPAPIGPPTRGAPTGASPSQGEARLEARDDAGTRILLYAGKPTPLIFHTAQLAPGDYKLLLNGADTGVEITLASPIRRSAGALTDESLPSRPQQDIRAKARTPNETEWRKQLVETLRETGINAAFAMCDDEAGRHADVLDAFTATGTMLFINPYTRPMSFNPARVYKQEMDFFNQRLALIAQANARYPSFGGFCFDFDPVGFLNRKMLLFYWGWGKQEQALRNYIARSDEAVYAEFTRRTGLKAPRLDEYILYTLAIGRPDFAPAIDLPTARWLEEMARCLSDVTPASRWQDRGRPARGVGGSSTIAPPIQPPGRRRYIDEAKLADLEKRIDAWSNYLMGIYEESHGSHLKVLREVAPSLRHTSSINLDHCVVKDGQYLPSAYRPLDFRYLTAWSDQVGGPDYAYQWLLSAAMLNTYPRRNEPIWIGSALGMVHGQAEYPGKFVRAIAHCLAHGASGAGFALEGFSTVLGGMNRETQWANMKGKPMAEGLRAGKDFLDRFAFLATECRGDFGVGILFSRTQMARQYLAQGFGTPQYKALVTLTRLGYTPRFVTEEEIADRGVSGVKALVIVGQTFPLPPKVVEGIESFARKGGRVLLDDASTIKLAGAESLGIAIPYEVGGRPYNWACPNIVGEDNPIRLFETEYKRIAPAVLKTLGNTGRALFVPEKGADSHVTVMQIDGGPDAKYLVAINDSTIRTQADWYQVKETLVPRKDLPPGWVLYDLTDEKKIGPAAPFACDLTATTARVFALLQYEMEAVRVAVYPSIRGDRKPSFGAYFRAAHGKEVEAVLPFRWSVVRPDGKVSTEAYRHTSIDGIFGNEVPMPLRATEGEWKIVAHSQLTGDTVEVPVRVRAPFASRVNQPVAEPLRQQLVVRNAEGIRARLKPENGTFLLPIFETPSAAKLLPVAEEVKKVLGCRGIEVEIRRNPAVSTYWLAYDPTPEQAAENARAEKGEAIGRIKCTTVNRNDYFATLSGYVSANGIILLDVAGEKGNEMAEHLAKIGVLWPEVSPAFPGPGGAVVQMVDQAFGPRASALVIQATDVDGLIAGARALVPLEGDRIDESLGAARAASLQQWLIGDQPSGHRMGDIVLQDSQAGLPTAGMTTRHKPRPFEIRFLDKKPITEAEVARPAEKAHEAIAVPGTLVPKQYVPQLRRGDSYEDAWSPGADWPKDLRFADATLLVVDVKQAGKTAIVAEGSFRYSDRKPRSQANWEDILELREKIVPKERRPMEFEVVLDGKPAGKLDKLTTAMREVEVKAPPGFGREGAVKTTEEVVIAVRGAVDLPGGRHRLMLIHRNIVDGKLEKVSVGATP